MAYTLNEYYGVADSTDTRELIYSDNDTAAHLLSYYRQNGAEIALWECVNANDSDLPMHNKLMEVLDEKINTANVRVIVTGIDAYLSLLSQQYVKAFLTALHQRVDAGKLNAVYLISCSHFDASMFMNPKYENSLQVVHIGSNGQHVEPPIVNVVSQKWAQADNNPTSWRALLKSLGQFEATGKHTLVLDNYTSRQAGLSDSVSQLLDVSDVAKRYYGIPSTLPKDTLETLLQKLKEGNLKPLDYLKSQFGVENASTRLALKRLLELRNDRLWAAYIWFLKKVIDSGSYLSVVLSEVTTPDNLLRKYVCDTAISVLLDTNAKNYADERAFAIKEIGCMADPLIIEFIVNIKQQTNEIVAQWLNCDVKEERIEIIHRVSEGDLTQGLPKMWHNLYPLLADYLSDDYTYRSDELNAYFRDYRRLKIANCVTADFVKRAFDLVLPQTIAQRDSVLQELAADKNVALLVVDGMGAEYFPLILALADRKSLNVEFASVAAVRLPTSTKFNHISWEESRRLKPDMREIDNISHDGAAKHENCSPSQNIAATLAVFEDIANRVATGLTSYERVVLTADHGSSRLAVLAREKGLDETLQWSEEPRDWRYAVAPPNAERPPELEPSYNAENNVTYWVVRGYNRLPKKGGKLSVHGGATLEERLVPIIVFSKAKSDRAPKLPDKQKTVEQLVEKADFDI